MSSNAHTFVIGGVGRPALVASLVAAGFELGETRPFTTTVLDTFDGRIHDDGLCLELRGEGELVLSGNEVVPARLARIVGTPRFARDLPPGPFRSRLAAITDVRALLPKLSVSATATPLALRDHNGKTTVEGVVLDAVEIDGNLAVGSRCVLELHGAVGFAKPIRHALDAVADLDGEHVDEAVATALAIVAGADLAGYRDSPTVPLEVDTPAVEGFRDVLTNLAATIEANWAGTVDEIDPEFLHDLRVAVRRTRALLAAGQDVLPPDVVSEARAGFAWLGSLTGPARDLDVYLIEWHGYADPLGASAAAALEPVRALLDERSHVAHRELERRLQSDEAAQLMVSWRHRLATMPFLEPRGRDGDEPLGRVVDRLVRKAHRRLVDHGREIDDTSPAEQVHDLRKDAKKLRYLLECFGSLLPDDERKRFVQRLKALQDNLGAHQDAEVHVALIREIADELHRRPSTSPDTLLAMGQLTERLEQIRVATRAEFAERFADYDRKRTHRALDAALHGLRG
jgi:CHAD domain-containing protein